MKKIVLSILTITVLCLGVNAQNVNIPDAIFKNYLLANTSINTNGDTEIQVNEATAFAGVITVTGLGISDLTGIEAFTALIELYCENNQLTNLDVTTNTALIRLFCNNNQLTSLDVNTALEWLFCDNNQLTSLDVSANTNLFAIYCENNQLTSFDLPSSTIISALGCSNNLLTSLDISALGIEFEFLATNNPNLTCVEVSDVAWWNTFMPNAIDSWASYSASCVCTVTIPDTNFKNYLLANTIININADTEIQCSEASAFTGTINVQGLGVLDLTGVEAFTAITQLICSDNQLTSIDVSANIALKWLICDNNLLTNIDVTANTALIGLWCNNNQIASIDVAANTVLGSLDCSNNLLTSINVAANTSLTSLVCNNNQLTSIDLTANMALTGLTCNDNLLTSLDMSANTVLSSLLCFNNQLTNLDVANGNNTNITNANFNAVNNPNLTCIEVDDVTYSTANWTNIDTIASFSHCCSVTIPDPNFKNYLLANAAINTNADAEIQCSEASAFTGIIDVNGLGIVDLTGIEAFTALAVLYCYNNQLTSLDVTANTALTELFCNNNQLTSLDVAANSALTQLQCNNNQLTSLDVATNTALTELICYNNQLTSLDVTANTALTLLNCSSNQITSLDVATNTALTLLNCSSNQITSLDMSANTLLTILSCHNNQLISLVVTANTALTSLYCYNNQLTNLDVTANTALTQLQCNNNQLTGLNVSANTVLSNLQCNNNQLTSLNVSANTVLTNLQCFNNQLSNLNVANGNNTNISNGNFNARNNPNLTCIQVDDVDYSTANWTFIDPFASFSTNCLTTVIIPDDNFKTYLVGNAAINTNMDAEIQYSEANAFTGTIDVSGLGITDLTGIEAFTALTVLDISNNLLTSLFENFSAATNLMNHNRNSISFNLASNTALMELYCYNNELSSLDVSANTTLSVLDCSDNLLVSLDMSANTSLTELYCNDNQLTSLDVRNGNNTNISNQGFDATNNPNLTCINVDNATYSTANWTSIDPQTSFSETCSTLGIDDYLESNISLYPNPTYGKIELRSNNLEPITSISLLDINGRTLKTQNLNCSTCTVNIDKMLGFYFLKINTSSGTITKKIIFK